jgi:toxin YoeB
MRNFYLYETALIVDSVEELEEGLNNLNQIILNRNNDRDCFLCNPTIWECDTTQGLIYELFGDIVNQELQRVIPSIFSSFIEHEVVYNSPNDMDGDFLNDCNAFTGIKFIHGTIPVSRRVFNSLSYDSFVKNCLRNGVIQTNSEMSENLLELFPKFDFSPRAIEECLNWKQQNQGLYNRLFDLFYDIPLNPFMNGIGETEVLRHMKGVASKRINQAHRVTYKLENNRVTILACSGHYD